MVCPTCAATKRRARRHAHRLLASLFLAPTHPPSEGQVPRRTEGPSSGWRAPWREQRCDVNKQAEVCHVWAPSRPVRTGTVSPRATMGSGRRTAQRPPREPLPPIYFLLTTTLPERVGCPRLACGAAARYTNHALLQHNTRSRFGRGSRVLFASRTMGAAADEPMARSEQGGSDGRPEGLLACAGHA